MWEYTDKVKEHFLNPKNVGIIKNPDGIGEVGSLACGDALKLYFKLDKKGKIKEAKFQTFGCASAIASSSALTEMLKGKTLNEAEKITNEDISNYLGGLPKEKIHCSVLGQDALKKAIISYKGSKEDKKDGTIICECFGVTDKQIINGIKKNKLKSIEEISNFLKAGGGCGECHSKIESLLISSSFFSKNTSKKITNVQKIKMIDLAFEKHIKPALIQDGGNIDLIDVEGNKVYVKLRGACASCGKSQKTLKHYVETKLREFVSPDLIIKEA